MEIVLKQKGTSYLIGVKGDLDLYNASGLKEAFAGLVKKGVNRIIIDLGEVVYLDSSGIGVLIHICTISTRCGLRLAMVNIGGPVRKVIELTRLEEFFPIYPDLAGAAAFMEAE